MMAAEAILVAANWNEAGGRVVGQVALTRNARRARAGLRLGAIATTLALAGGARAADPAPAAAVAALPAPASVAAPAAPAAKARRKPLFERLGGRGAISAVVDDFLRRVTADRRINGRFINADVERLRTLLVDFVCESTGGPCVYAGRDMHAAHGSLQLVVDEFNALVEDLSGALVALHVPEAERKELLDALAPLKGEVVNTPSGPDVTPDPTMVHAATARVAELRASGNAADLLEAAFVARVRGQRSYAEQLYSSAERLMPPQALGGLDPLFRDGGPERITTAFKVFPRDTPAQPKGGVGASEDDDQPVPSNPPAPTRASVSAPKRASLSGQLRFSGGADAVMGVVALTPVDGKFARRAPRQRIVEQRGRRFAPHVLAVPLGSTVSFPNFDPFFHNVFSLSPARSFDLGIYRSGESRDVTFDKEGFVRIGCNLHDNMSAFIAVVNAPHYTVTGPDGRFHFRNLAPGRYQLRAWTEGKAEPLSQPIQIASGENSTTLDLGAAPGKGDLGTDKFGVPRGKAR
jgi:hemoglobin